MNGDAKGVAREAAERRWGAGTSTWSRPISLSMVFAMWLELIGRPILVVRVSRHLRPVRTAREFPRPCPARGDADMVLWHGGKQVGRLRSRRPMRPPRPFGGTARRKPGEARCTG
ncbi:hypothetical protein GCM10009731_53350 [Streptomyces globosus]